MILLFFLTEFKTLSFFTQYPVCIMTKLSKFEIAQMIDVSAVQANSTSAEVDQVINLADEYDCTAVFALGEQTKSVLDKVRLLNQTRVQRGKPAIKVGGVVGFPDGGALTEVKVFEAEQLLQLGCHEIDMVLNVGLVLSDQWDHVKADIQAVKKAVGATPLKVILECGYLSDEQIITASQLAQQAGANWIKSGTGWTAKKTTVHTIELMKKAVGEKCNIKAAGGVRDLQTLLDMYDAGARRFGIGVRTARAILDSVQKTDPA